MSARVTGLKGEFMSYIIDRFEGDNAVCEKEDRTTLPVSYTHLDVYKRQVCTRPGNVFTATR